MLTVIAIVISLFLRHKKERTAQFKQIADRMGFLFYPKGDAALLENLAGLHLFSQGHSKKVSNLLRGVSGQRGVTAQVEVGIFASVCDRRRAIQHDRYTNRDRFSFPTAAPSPVRPAARESLSQNWRRLWLSKHRLRRPPEILEKVSPSGKRRTEGSRGLYPRPSNLFETEEGLSVEANGDRLIFYRGGKRIRPEDVGPFMEEGLRVLRLFKR